MSTEGVYVDYPKVGNRNRTEEPSDMGPIRDQVVVLPTHDALVQTAAGRFVSAAAEAIEAYGRFSVALSGGSTPTSLYALLATAPYASRVDWSRIHVFWGDERCVPPWNLASNYRMACEALLDHVPVLEGPYQPGTLPAQVIAPRAGRLRWLADADAATELDARG